MARYKWKAKKGKRVFVHTHTAAVQDPESGLFEGRVGPLIAGRR